MNKGLFAGAVFLLVGAVLVVVLLGQSGKPTGAVTGPNVTFPITFHDGATLAGGNLTINSGREIDLNNCGTALYRPAALSPIWSSQGTAQVTTTVSVTGLAEGDSLTADWDSVSATSSLQSLGLALIPVNASTGVAFVQFVNLSLATSAAVANSGTIRVCYFD